MKQENHLAPVVKQTRGVGTTTTTTVGVGAAARPAARGTPAE